MLDDYSLSVRMSDFSLTARLLSLDGCQIDGRFVKVSCRDSWGSLFREMESSFLSAELLSPEVKVSVSYTNTQKFLIHCNKYIG